MAAQLHPPSPSMSLAWLSFSKLPTKVLTRLLSIIVSLLILTMASAAMAMLQEGDSGDAVRDLQNRLAVERCYSGNITGYFGSLTKQAVMDCQAKFGLAVDGVAGPKTMAALDGFAAPEAPKNVAKTPTNELQNGSQGEKVIALQRQLRDLNLYEGAIDGIFGPKTEAAVVSFQRTNGLVQTGVFGELENKAIASAQPAPSQIAAAAPSLQPSLQSSTIGRNQLALGDAGRDVQRLQERLKELNLFDSAATGYFGDLTKSAVSSFQTSRRLPATGIVDGATLGALGISGTQANAGSADLQTQSANREAFNRSGFTNGGFTNGGGGFTDAMVPQKPIGQANFGTANVEGGSRFVVIIPKRDGVNLNQVRKLVPEATEGKSSIGAFIQAGTFANQKAAEQHSRMLQAYNLDARVAYR
jgi:peptidoglycan hydrolase-like protein with peptidoglycan-binding domain